MSLLLFILIHLGGVYVITQSVLFALPRKRLYRWLTTQRLPEYLHQKRAAPVFALLPVAVLTAVVHCPACFGFWWALVLQQLGYWPFTTLHSAPLEAALAGTAIGAFWGVYGPTATEEQNDGPTKEEKKHVQ